MAKDGRLHLRLSPDLKEQAQAYADRKNTTLTELVTRFFTKLIEEDEKEKRRYAEAEQV